MDRKACDSQEVAKVKLPSLLCTDTVHKGEIMGYHWPPDIGLSYFRALVLGRMRSSLFLRSANLSQEAVSPP